MSAPALLPEFNAKVSTMLTVWVEGGGANRRRLVADAGRIGQPEKKLAHWENTRRRTKRLHWSDCWRWDLPRSASDGCSQRVTPEPGSTLSSQLEVSAVSTRDSGSKDGIQGTQKLQ